MLRTCYCRAFFGTCIVLSGFLLPPRAFAIFPAQDSVDQYESNEPGPSYYFAPQVGNIDIHILGTYEYVSDSIGDYYHPTHLITVHVLPPIDGPMVPLDLVLSSYEPINWQLDVQPGAVINEIVLNGYYQQNVFGAGSVNVINRSPAQNWLGQIGFQWSSGGTPLLVQNVQSLLGAPISQFAGAYGVQAATIRGTLVPEPSTLSLLTLGAIGLLARRRFAQ